MKKISDESVIKLQPHDLDGQDSAPICGTCWKISLLLCPREKSLPENESVPHLRSDWPRQALGNISVFALHPPIFTVYKGRKKKTLEYFAAKSVDKSQKNKLLQEDLDEVEGEVKARVVAAYETSAHLWLVLEYCVGGDLMTLLRQVEDTGFTEKYIQADARLPEESVHDLARDLVKALQFLHSKGIIYCDLKPSNILLDENGRIKLPQAKRGTPCYMAPELFQDGGVHSYASDLWALGCVLYECYTGRPPFIGKEFTHLVKAILSDPVPPLPDNPSSNFVNLINCLLIKDPAERVRWPELCQHGFWRTKFTSIPLPPQPAFDNMIQLSAKMCLSECNGDKPLQQRTPPKHRERDLNGANKPDVNSAIRSKGFETPTKNGASGRKFHTKVSDKVVDERQREPTKGVNLLRLSRIAKTNLRRENEKENYRRPVNESSGDNAEVKIENNDMELDFGENPEEDAPDESDNPNSTPEAQIHDDARVEEMVSNSNQSNIPAASDAAASDDLNTLEHDSCSENVEVAATPPSFGLQRKGQHIKTGSGCALDSDMSKSSQTLSQVHWHTSDLSVRPVMPSRKGDKALESLPQLPFDAPSTYDFIRLSSEQLDALNNKIVHTLNGNSSVSDKQNVIRYLEVLSGHADSANAITNGPIMIVLVKMLRQSKASVLHVQLASLIGLLIRHSTFIEPGLASSGIMGALTHGLRDKQEKERRFSMAALGELLFYISTQTEQAKDASALESPSKDSRSSGWQVPSAVVVLVSSILRKGEDAVTQLYALRTIENISSQGGDLASRFASQDVIGNLCYIFKATGKQESTRLTAGTCLVRLARFNPSSIQLVFEKLSFKDIVSAIIKGSPREQQVSLNLLIIALSESHFLSNIGRHVLSLFEEKQLLPSLISLIEQGPEVLRGKSLAFVALLCKCSRRWLYQFFCNARLLSAVDRLVKEKDTYLQQCTQLFVQAVSATVPGLLEVISGDIQQMLGGKRHGQIAALSGRANPRTNLHMLPVILHLLGSSLFKHRMVSGQVSRQLANLLKLLESSFQGRDDFQITLLRILESISEESSVIHEDPTIFIGQVLPSLAILYKGNKDGDARFLCLKNLFDIMVIFINDLPEAITSEDKQRLSDLKLLTHKYFLPLYPILIEDEDPIPLYAQKLLVMLIEFQYVKVSDILQPKTVSQCFEFLLGDLANANVNNVKLCLALASAPEMETKILSQLQVVRHIGNLLEFANAKEMEDFLEPTLGLCKAFILRAIGCRNVVSSPTDPDLLSSNTLDMSVAVNCIKDISDFGSNVGAFLELFGTLEMQTADLASECLVLLMKASPREATMGLLTNLSKLSNSLESCMHGGDYGLLLLRLLHALGFSCRQYISQAMILSISMADITRIQTILSDLRTSGKRNVADIASVVCAELQRLPRYV
ncbi:hypothetical protein ACLOJK_025350 [Asimina triloba]